MWGKGKPSDDYSDDDGPSDPRSAYASLATGEDDADENDENERIADEYVSEEEDDIIRPGDHIFVWQGFSQRHGIVLEAPSTVDTALDDDGDIYDDVESDITIITFYQTTMQSRQSTGALSSIRNLFGRNHVQDVVDEEPLTQNSFASREIKRQSLRQFKKNAKTVQKVKYGATVARRLLSTGGTATCIKADEKGLVMSRIKYLQDHPEILPEYSKLSANDECVAVWCRTGRWVTLQGASMLEIISASHAGSAVVAGGVVSQMTVTYMMPWIPGYVLVWSVPATVAYPILVPLLVGYGLTSLVPLEILRRYRKKWKETSDLLNRDFWTKASEEDRMTYFGESMDARNNELAQFFGMSEEDDETAGKYMPVNMEGATDDNDDFDIEDEDALNARCDKMAATYDMNGGAASSGRREGLLSGMMSRVKSSIRNVTQSLNEEPVSSKGPVLTPETQPISETTYEVKGRSSGESDALF